MIEFLAPDMALTHILVVSDVERSRIRYRDVLGARLHREYGGDSSVFDFNGTWLLLVTEGDPTPDKPDVASRHDTTIVNHAFTILVYDCHAAYEGLAGRGAEFRCSFRGPDGHLFEISEIR